MKELVQVRIMSYSDRYFWVEKSLPIEDQVEILLSLVQNWTCLHRVRTRFQDLTLLFLCTS